MRTYWPRLAAALTALALAASMWLLTEFFLHSRAGQSFDESAFSGSRYGRGKLWRLAEPVLDVVSIAFVAGAIIAVVAIALLRKRWSLALQAAVAVVGANVTTQLLKKEILHRSDYGLSERAVNTLPSGHTTVAASVSLALLIVVPRRLRPVVAVGGGAYTAATGIGTMVGQWHRVSDVLAAVLVASAWAALVLVVTSRSTADDARSAFLSSTAAIVVLACATGAALAAAWAVQSGLVTGGAGENVDDYLTAALAVVALTSACFGALLGLRQATAQHPEASPQP